MPTSPLPSVTGLSARYFGSSGLAGYPTTTYYQVQAIYPNGRSPWTYISVSTPTNLDSVDRVLVSWAPMPGAIGYDVVKTTTSAAPAATATVGIAVGLSYNSFTDSGQASFSYTPTAPTGYVGVAHFLYDFTVDGGAIGEIIPSVSDFVPINAVMTGGLLNAIVAVTSAGAATIAVGTHAGSSTASIISAQAKTVYSIGALLTNGTATPLALNATPVKMTAAGQLSITVATAALTAGKIEGWAFYNVASA